MKSNKTITITTNLFKLQLFWNGTIMSLQLGFLIGILALSLFAQSDAVRKLCVVALLLDVIICLFVIINGATMSIDDAEKSDTGDVVKESMDVTIDRDKKSSVSDKTTSTRKSNEIRNKVPVPNPQQPAESSNVTQQSTPVKEESAKEKTTMKPVEEMTEQDWEELFKME